MWIQDLMICHMDTGLSDVSWIQDSVTCHLVAGGLMLTGLMS